MSKPDHRVNPRLYEAMVHLRDNPNKYTVKQLAALYNLTRDQISGGIRRYKQQFNLRVLKEKRTQPVEIHRIELPKREINTERILLIGDLHEHFTVKGYFEWNKFLYDYYKITRVIFAGDCIDNHATSLHDPDPDLQSPGDELLRARIALQKWHTAFPNADVCSGNHEARIYRIATKNRISRAWLMDYATVLDTPTWNFQDQFVYDNVRYIHGEGMNAERRALMTGMSTACGDKHTQMYVKFIPQESRQLWAMQVGCGLDRNSKAAAYAINHPPQLIGSGVILDHGRVPIVLSMPQEYYR